MTSSRRVLILVSTVIAFSAVLSALPPWRIRITDRNPDILRRRAQARIQDESWDPNKYTDIYVTNLDVEISEEVLHEMFSEIGEIRSLELAKDFKGGSRGFAFIDFESSGDARRAMTLINGTQLGGKVVHLERTPKKEEGRDRRHHNWLW